MYFEHWLHHVCADKWYCFVSRFDILQVSFVDEGYISSIVGFLKIQQNYEQRWYDTSYSFSKLLYSSYNKTYEYYILCREETSVLRLIIKRMHISICKAKYYSLGMDMCVQQT